MRVAGQHQEHSLKCIFREVNVANSPLADAEDQAPVSLHELLKCRLIAFLGETRQERAIIRAATSGFGSRTRSDITSSRQSVYQYHVRPRREVFNYFGR